MGKLTPIAVAAVVAACAGCLTLGPRAGDCGDLGDSPVKRRVEAVLPQAAEKAVASGGGVPSRQALDQSGGSAGHPGHWYSKQRFRYVFRLVRDPADSHQSREKSWALPATDYPRAIRAVYTDVCAAVEAAGVKPTEAQCDGSTFLIRYQTTSPRGHVINGTLRGRIGPEDPHTHDPPLQEPYYTQIAVDVREEAEREK